MRWRYESLYLEARLCENWWKSACQGKLGKNWGS